MNLKDFYFELPENLIAQKPLENRANSRLMVVNKKNGEIKDEKSFNCILHYLKKGDCIVLNDTKVLPARLLGNKKDTGGNVEILLLKRKDIYRWEVLVKPGKKAKIGDTIVFSGGFLEAFVEDIVEEGTRIIKFSFDGIFEEILDKIGQMPLPPYITQRLEDKTRYQTIYAKNDGSSAAPTAGLHFTQEILEEMKKMDISIAKLTLHVGLGTFRPVKAENIYEHKMHSEYYNLGKEDADIINKAKANGGRIIAVGTTTSRTLETIANEKGQVSEKSGWTDIFIYPGYKFKIVDNLITNFHLPESTLIMLVSALSKKEYIFNAYNRAILEKYRFFSFGDAMFITEW